MKKSVLLFILILVFASVPVFADFSDIPSDFWGREAVEFVVSENLFYGTGDTEFSPDGQMTRAMLVTVLSRFDSVPDNGVSSFSDIDPDAWYAPSVIWAEKAGVIDSGGKFRPDDSATREEIAEMIYRFSLYKTGNTAENPKAGFADYTEIGERYTAGVDFCVNNSIISGYPDNTFKPNNNATRAEVAVMIQRLSKYLENTWADNTNNSDFFEKYRSNTSAGSGNQHVFLSDGEEHTGRLFYKITTGGTYNYAFSFSGTIDSTFAGGETSHSEMICEDFVITALRVSVCKASDMEKFRKYNEFPDKVDMNTNGNSARAIITSEFTDVTFGGEASAEIKGGETVFTDPVSLTFEDGDFICIEVSFKGTQIPYHHESIISTYIKGSRMWEASRLMPFPGIIGCDREVKKTVAFLGDSITQGIGTGIDSYMHWNARIAEMLGSDYSYWNLGLGFARAFDAAKDGAWLAKVKHSDVAVVCLGVNDLLSGRNTEEICSDLSVIVDSLNDAGITVILQTVPPFDYDEATEKTWREVNAFIKDELSKNVAAVFDTVPVLGKTGEPQNALYGGHPNEEGCLKWAEALKPVVEKVLEE